MMSDEETKKEKMDEEFMKESLLLAEKLAAFQDTHNLSATVEFAEQICLGQGLTEEEAPLANAMQEVLVGELKDFYSNKVVFNSINDVFGEPRKVTVGDYSHGLNGGMEACGIEKGTMGAVLRKTLPDVKIYLNDCLENESESDLNSFESYKTLKNLVGQDKDVRRVLCFLVVKKVTDLHRKVNCLPGFIDMLMSK